jgi:MOSC domain-containing protein YiiM
VSNGGIPKRPIAVAQVGQDGITGDRRAHEKHNSPTRALSLLDEEMLLELRGEGYPISPGSIGENVTLRNVGVQHLAPGTLLQLGDVTVRLEAPRKPCFVLDAIDVRLKEAAVGRCGYLASIVHGGELRPGVRVQIVEPN